MKTLLFENHEIEIILEAGIVICNWKSSYIDLNTAERMIKYRLESTNFGLYPLLSNIRSIIHGTREARVFLASEKGCEGIIAAALLIDSPLGSLVSNFWLNINKPLRPTKIFSDELKAKEWLTQYVKKV